MQSAVSGNSARLSISGKAGPADPPRALAPEGVTEGTAHRSEGPADKAPDIRGSSRRPSTAHSSGARRESFPIETEQPRNKWLTTLHELKESRRQDAPEDWRPEGKQLCLLFHTSRGCPLGDKCTLRHVRIVPGMTMTQTEVDKIHSKPPVPESPPQQLLRVTTSIRDATAEILEIPHNYGEDPRLDPGFWSRRKPFRRRRRLAESDLTAEDAAKRAEEEKAQLANEEEEKVKAKDEYYRKLIQKRVMGSGAVSDAAELRTKKARGLVHAALDLLAEAEGFRIQRMEPVEDPAATVTELANKPPPSKSELREMARLEKERLRQEREEMKQEAELRAQSRRDRPSEPIPLLAKKEFRKLHAEEFRVLDEAIKRLKRAAKLLDADSADLIRVMSLEGLAQYYRRVYPVALKLLQASTSKIEEAIIRDKEFCAVPAGERCSAYHYLGLVLRAMGRKKEAITALQKATSHDETDPRPVKVSELG